MNGTKGREDGVEIEPQIKSINLNDDIQNDIVYECLLDHRDHRAFVGSVRSSLRSSMIDRSNILSDQRMVLQILQSNSSALDGSPLMYKFVGSMVWGSTGLKPFTRDTWAVTCKSWQQKCSKDLRGLPWYPPIPNACHNPIH